MTNYQPGEELKEKIVELFGSDSKVNKIIWELVPNYFKVKLPNLEIISVHLKTNETGNEIKIFIFITNVLTIGLIATILAFLDLINISSSNNWEPDSYSKEDISVGTS